VISVCIEIKGHPVRLSCDMGRSAD